MTGWVDPDESAEAWRAAWAAGGVACDTVSSLGSGVGSDVGGDVGGGRATQADAALDAGLLARQLRQIAAQLADPRLLPRRVSRPVLRDDLATDDRDLTARPLGASALGVPEGQPEFVAQPAIDQCPEVRVRGVALLAGRAAFLLDAGEPGAGAAQILAELAEPGRQLLVPGGRGGLGVLQLPEFVEDLPVVGVHGRLKRADRGPRPRQQAVGCGDAGFEFCPVRLGPRQPVDRLLVLGDGLGQPLE